MKELTREEMGNGFRIRDDIELNKTKPAVDTKTMPCEVQHEPLSKKFMGASKPWKPKGRK